MALPQFELHRPTTIEEATELLDHHGDEAIIHCGGTELLLVMKLGYAPYSQLIDIKHIAELRGVVDDGDLWIGANTTHHRIEQHPGIRARWAGLAGMAASIGNRRVRNVGTIGGNLCFSEPHSDPATALLAADASLECRRGGEPARTIPMADFVVGPFQTALRPGEILVGVRVPPLADGAVLVHRKITFHERAAATVTVSCGVSDNRLEHLRLAVGAVGVRPGLVPEASDLLVDSPADALSSAVLDSLGEAAVAAGQPVSDGYGSAPYRAHLLRVLVRRAVADAIDELRGAQ